MAIDVVDKELLLRDSEQRTVKEWIEYFNGKYTKGQIYGFCYHRGKKFRERTKEEISRTQSQNSRKYHINEDYFKTWTHNMAYVFGFWCADGCIYRGQMFDITQSMKDKYIIKRIAEELEYKGPLFDRVDNQSCRINFSCVTIYNDIISLGGTENKSMTLKFPDVPEEFLPDFIRGFFDGDGSVFDVQGMRVNCAFTSGSKEFLDKLLEVLKTYADVEGGSYDLKTYTIKFGKKDSLKIRDYMYKDNPELFLLRKKKHFYKY